MVQQVKDLTLSLQQLECCYVVGLIFGLETSICWVWQRKKKKKKKKKKSPKMRLFESRRRKFRYRGPKSKSILFIY